MVDSIVNQWNIELVGSQFFLVLYIFRWGWEALHDRYRLLWCWQSIPIHASRVCLQQWKIIIFCTLPTCIHPNNRHVIYFWMVKSFEWCASGISVPAKQIYRHGASNSLRCPMILHLNFHYPLALGYLETGNKKDMLCWPRNDSDFCH